MAFYLIRKILRVCTRVNHPTLRALSRNHRRQKYVRTLKHQFSEQEVILIDHAPPVPQSDCYHHSLALKLPLSVPLAGAVTPTLTLEITSPG